MMSGTKLGERLHRLRALLSHTQSTRNFHVIPGPKRAYLFEIKEILNIIIACNKNVLIQFPRNSLIGDGK